MWAETVIGVTAGCLASSLPLIVLMLYIIYGKLVELGRVKSQLVTTKVYARESGVSLHLLAELLTDILEGGHYAVSGFGCDLVHRVSSFPSKSVRRVNPDEADDFYMDVRYKELPVLAVELASNPIDLRQFVVLYSGSDQYVGAFDQRLLAMGDYAPNLISSIIRDALAKIGKQAVGEQNRALLEVVDRELEAINRETSNP